MKYIEKKFSTPANSKAYVDNWDAIFGDKTPRPIESESESAPESEQTVTTEKSVTP